MVRTAGRELIAAADCLDQAMRDLRQRSEARTDAFVDEQLRAVQNLGGAPADLRMYGGSELVDVFDNDLKQGFRMYQAELHNADLAWQRGAADGGLREKRLAEKHYKEFATARQKIIDGVGALVQHLSQPVDS